MQWESISRGWTGDKPDVGDPGPDLLQRLLDVLSPFTTGDCLLAVWEGYHWSAPSMLRVPNRNYVVFAGPLAAAGGQLGQHSGHAFVRQTPNLLWPVDRAWFVGSEIDFDSTLIAGPAALVDAVLTADGIEAWPVGPEDSLALTGDSVNGPPLPKLRRWRS